MEDRIAVWPAVDRSSRWRKIRLRLTISCISTGPVGRWFRTLLQLLRQYYYGEAPWTASIFGVICLIRLLASHSLNISTTYVHM